MIVTTVMIEVKGENVQDFIKATIKNHEASIKEPGNRRFDFLQRTDDPTMFMLYEAYGSEEDAKAHKETAHYNDWKKTVAEYMAQPREGIRYRAIKPA